MSLRLKWCAAISFILAIAGMAFSIHYQIHKPRYLGISYSGATYSGAQDKSLFHGFGQWSIHEGQPRFVQLVIVESRNGNFGYYISDSPSAKPRDRRGGRTNVDVIPSGIYINGVRVPATTDQRVFVLKSDASLVPIPLTAEELEGFTPAFVDQRLKWTPLWRDRIRPLVEPVEIAEEELQAAIAQEAKELAEEKARGITRVRIHTGSYNERGKRVRDLDYVTDWLEHPDGTWTHLNTFFGRRGSVDFCRHPTGATSRAINPHRFRKPPRFPKEQFTRVDRFPFSYDINGETVERGKAYVQRPDMSITVLELTPEESQQFTKDLLSSADRFVASDLYIRKIAPLLGEPVVQSAAQATRPDVPTPPRQN